MYGYAAATTTCIVGGLITMLNRVCHEITGSVANSYAIYPVCTCADSKCLPSKT